MRARIAFAVVFMAVIVAAAVIARQDGATPVQAQSTAPRPLLLNEVEDWCGDHRCNAVYSDLASGYLRVVLNQNQGDLSGSCSLVSIPDGIEGWAYAKVVDGDRVPMPAYPTASEGQTSSEAEATWIASLPGDEVAVLSIADARQLPDTASICELVIKRVQ